MKDEIFIQDLEYDRLTTQQLLDSLDQSSIINRGRSIAALARRAVQNDGLVDVVVAAISVPQNKEARIIGTISVSQVGYACLWWFGSAQTRSKLQILLQDWQEPDRSDLLWFMKSQGIEVGA